LKLRSAGGINLQTQRRRSPGLDHRRARPHRLSSSVAARRVAALELAPGKRQDQSGSLTMAAISAAFTLGHVAKMLGEDEDWLHDLSINMFAEDGCLWVYGVGLDGVPAFTEHDIDCLRQIIADERAAGTAPKPRKIE
jgi:hypothetical protein